MCKQVREELGILTVLLKVVSFHIEHDECVKLLVSVDYS